jgi:hypothetical protein
LTLIAPFCNLRVCFFFSSFTSASVVVSSCVFVLCCGTVSWVLPLGGSGWVLVLGSRALACCCSASLSLACCCSSSLLFLTLPALLARAHAWWTIGVSGSADVVCPWTAGPCGVKNTFNKYPFKLLLKHCSVKVEFRQEPCFYINSVLAQTWSLRLFPKTLGHFSPCEVG